MDEKVKCKNCFYFIPDCWGDKGFGDCKNKLIRKGKNAMIKIIYCDEFGISENFGCIYGTSHKNEMVLDTQEQRKSKGALKCSCGSYCATDKEGE